MKNKIIILIILRIIFIQGINSQNYNTILIRTFTNNTKVVNPSANDCILDYEYFDDIGQLEYKKKYFNLVEKENTEKASCQLFEYDVLGRLTNSWLPIPVDESFEDNLNLNDVKNFYQDQHPYSTAIYEQSPLNKIANQFGEGDQWRKDKKMTKLNYATNVDIIDGSTIGIPNLGHEFLRCINFKVVDGKLIKGGNYPKGVLNVIASWDEDNDLSLGFSDLQGRVVLERQMNNNEKHDTYMGQLCYVLPPLAIDKLTLYEDNNEIMKQYAYIYKYNGRGNCVKKRLPGCDWIEYVYDKANNVIFSRDGEKNIKKQWTFSLYDTFGRVVLEGICNDTVSVYSKVVKANYTGESYKGYSLNIQLPANYNILNANYYDNYDYLSLSDFQKKGLEFVYNSSFQDAWGKPTSIISEKYKSKGLLTGKWLSTFGSTFSLCESYYYDRIKRMIQKRTTNHLSGLNEEHIAYDFNGLHTKRKLVHAAAGKAIQTVPMFKIGSDR